MRLGGENTYDGAAISVAYVHFHPSYDAETLNNNLAILKMVKHKLIKKNSVRRIRYEQSYTPIRNDAIVTILGWGAQDVSFDYFYSLMGLYDGDLLLWR